MSASAPFHDASSTSSKTGSWGISGQMERATLPIMLLEAREALMKNFRPMLASHDLTDQQWRVLRVLEKHEDIDASELAERAFILAPSLTRILRALEERGLMRRQRDARDARRTLLGLTKDGAVLIERIQPERAAIYARIEERFPEEKVAKLSALLEDLAQSVQSLGHERGLRKKRPRG